MMWQLRKTEKSREAGLNNLSEIYYSNHEE